MGECVQFVHSVWGWWMKKIVKVKTKFCTAQLIRTVLYLQTAVESLLINSFTLQCQRPFICPLVDVWCAGWSLSCGRVPASRGCSWLSWQQCWWWRGPVRTADSPASRPTPPSAWRAASEPSLSTPPCVPASASSRWANTEAALWNSP